MASSIATLNSNLQASQSAQSEKKGGGARKQRFSIGGALKIVAVAGSVIGAIFGAISQFKQEFAPSPPSPPPPPLPQYPMEVLDFDSPLRTSDSTYAQNLNFPLTQASNLLQSIITSYRVDVTSTNYGVNCAASGACHQMIAIYNLGKIRIPYDPTYVVTSGEAGFYMDITAARQATQQIFAQLGSERSLTRYRFLQLSSNGIAMFNNDTVLGNITGASSSYSLGIPLTDKQIPELVTREVVSDESPLRRRIPSVHLTNHISLISSELQAVIGTVDATVDTFVVADACQTRIVLDGSTLTCATVSTLNCERFAESYSIFSDGDSEPFLCTKALAIDGSVSCARSLVSCGGGNFTLTADPNAPTTRTSLLQYRNIVENCADVYINSQSFVRAHSSMSQGYYATQNGRILNQWNDDSMSRVYTREIFTDVCNSFANVNGTPCVSQVASAIALGTSQPGDPIMCGTADETLHVWDVATLPRPSSSSAASDPPECPHGDSYANLPVAVQPMCDQDPGWSQTYGLAAQIRCVDGVVQCNPPAVRIASPNGVPEFTTTVDFSTGYLTKYGAGSSIGCDAASNAACELRGAYQQQFCACGIGTGAEGATAGTQPLHHSGMNCPMSSPALNAWFQNTDSFIRTQYTPNTQNIVCGSEAETCNQLDGNVQSGFLWSAYVDSFCTQTIFPPQPPSAPPPSPPPSPPPLAPPPPFYELYDSGQGLYNKASPTLRNNYSTGYETVRNAEDCINAIMFLFPNGPTSSNFQMGSGPVPEASGGGTRTCTFERPCFGTYSSSTRPPGCLIPDGCYTGHRVSMFGNRYCLMNTGSINDFVNSRRIKYYEYNSNLASQVACTDHWYLCLTGSSTMYQLAG